MNDPNDYEIRDLDDDPEYEKYVIEKLELNIDLNAAGMDQEKVSDYDSWHKSRWG